MNAAIAITPAPQQQMNPGNTKFVIVYAYCFHQTWYTDVNIKQQPQAAKTCVSVVYAYLGTPSNTMIVETWNKCAGKNKGDN